VFPYNIFAYCSICRVDCKFARNKKNSGYIRPRFNKGEEELRQHTFHIGRSRDKASNIAKLW
jgi:hypothetical protein